jgi:hypothetical protein
MSRWRGAPEAAVCAYSKCCSRYFLNPMSEPTPPLAPPEFLPHEVYIITPPQRRYWVHALLLLATIFTTLVIGARLENNFLTNQPAFSVAEDALPIFPLSWIMQQPARLLWGIPFSLTLMGILLAHEMGHYLYCKKYDVYATLPYFIPAPTLIGTLGAFIRIQSPIRSRAALFDIGIAGPIAGFVVAVPVTIVGLVLSKGGASPNDAFFGFPLIFRLLHALVPFGGAKSVPFEQVLLHPIAIAGWVGMFATSLNLLPGGQLDGGHIVFSVAPKMHKLISRGAIAILVPLGIFYWVGWLVWGVLLFLSGLRHPNVPLWPELDAKRRKLALVAVALLALTLVLAPFKGGSLVDIILGIIYPQS